jgi:regulator of protease activity HflC (stomatin/prohibitin superfamily)
MPNTARSADPSSPLSSKTRSLVLIGLIIMGLIVFMAISLSGGGNVMGPTHIEPGNVGLVIDNYHGVIERQLMDAGTHWQGPWERVIEVPTAQRTLSMVGEASDSGGSLGAVQVNTVSNMLTVDVSVQYQITKEHAADLYHSYQDQFADINRFERENLEPAVKGAINYAIGDMDTATALTTPGKLQAEADAKKTLNDEWAPRGIVFSNVMIRGIQQDQASKDLLSTTLAKMQDIENAKLALQQQQFDNTTLLQQANAQAKINQLQNSTLTDLYVQDQLLGRVKKVYMPSDELMGILKQ